MQITGNIRKLASDINLETREVAYSLPIGEELIPLNAMLGTSVSLKNEGEIHCINCGRKSNKSFAQGHCFPCMRKLASCDTCIMKPELCHFHEGTCREPNWAEKNCFVDHYVYLSKTSGLKIGITRGTQVPTRWVDQGAIEAMPIYRTSTRRIAGLLEKPASGFIADKTNWRAMLKNEYADFDFTEELNKAKPQLNDIIEKIHHEFGEDALTEVTQAPEKFVYPVLEYPSKVVSHNLDKTSEAAGTLMGIKGQYLIFDTGVINMRKYTGYKLTVSAS